MNLTKNKMKPVTTLAPGEVVEEKYNGSNAKFVVFKTITFQEENSVEISFNSLENFQYISWGDGTLDTKKTSHIYENPKEKSFVIVVYGVDYLKSDRIQGHVFSPAGYIQEIYFGEGVKITAIGDYGGFVGGNALKKVSNISQIPTSCFADQTNLTEVTFGSDCTMIGLGAFSNTTPPSSEKICLVIPKHIKTISMNAFSNSNFKVCIEYTEDNKPEKYSDIGQIYYYYSETEPTTVGNYWHYVNGEPTVWIVEE